ncbi:MAG: ABC transporter ATP-binding protein [Rhodospirillales bacterium]|jgi:putative hydroxymethylpyrimidine transport system ATP-binding protein|nr:ABC transporter ATP-binding protein [Rhodospirillales bacterium]
MLKTDIHLKNITVSINTQNLFQNLDMMFDAGKWTCLLGPSGVGKSMLLRVILGLVGSSTNSGLKCTGAVHDSDSSPLQKELISFMAQRDMLYPWLNVRDNVTLGTRLRSGRRHVSDANKHADELLDAVGMADHGNQMPATLSGGMAQRVALARTLAEDRPIILMDEPFSALDAITKIKTQELSAKLLKARTVLMVTHDPLEALRLGHKVIVMKGHPVHVGDPLIPDGLAPRGVDNPEILEMQGALLRQLAEEPLC